MTDEPTTDPDSPAEPFAPLAAIAGDTPVAPAHVIASLALSLAIKYVDGTVVKDGVMYNAYKLEGRNLQPVNLDHVFDVARRMERWLLGSSERIAKIVADAVVAGIEQEEAEAAAAGEAGAPTPDSTP